MTFYNYKIGHEKKLDFQMNLVKFNYWTALIPFWYILNAILDIQMSVRHNFEWCCDDIWILHYQILFGPFENLAPFSNPHIIFCAQVNFTTAFLFWHYDEKRNPIWVLCNFFVLFCSEYVPKNNSVLTQNHATSH